MDAGPHREFLDFAAGKSQIETARILRVSRATIQRAYPVGDADNVIPPSIQLFMANRAKAHITHVHGAHPSMIEHPEATVAAILAAVAATQ